MTTLEARLYFTLPPLPWLDIHQALNLARSFGTRADFFDLLHSQRKIFEHYPRVLSILKDFYGPKEIAEENPFKKAREEIKQIALREEIYKDSPEDREGFEKVRKKFRGRYLQGCPPFARDSES